MAKNTLSLLKRLEYNLVGNSLSDLFYKFLKVHTGYLIFNGLPGIFINTFLMSRGGDMNVVLYYNAIVFMSCAVSMLFASTALRRYNAGNVSLVGVVLYNVLYLLLILLGNNASRYFYVLGVVNGLASGFYWISYSKLLTDSTNDNTRDKALAFIGISGSAVNLVIPLFSGFVISTIPGDWGYLSIFALALIIACFTAVGLLRLPRENIVKTPSKQIYVIKRVFKSKCWLLGLFSQTIMGVREGAFGVILNLLLYGLIKSEMLIGFNTFLSGGAAIVCFLIISKVIRPDNRVRFMTIAVAALLATSIGFVFCINPVYVILFSVLNALFLGFVTNSTFSVFLSLIEKIPGAVGYRPELFAIKEFFLATGRCIGIAVIVIVNIYAKNSMFWQAITLVFLTLTQVVTIFVSRAAIRRVACLPEEGRMG